MNGKEKTEQNPCGAGRPRAEIDWKVVENALQAHCTGVEIAGFLGIHPDTLYKYIELKYGMNISQLSAQFNSKGKTLLKMSQFDEAVRKRDRGMLIWLGKQLLEQKDNKDLKLDTDKGAIVVVQHYGNKEPKPYSNEQNESKN